jgi:hypothetical protein
MTLSDLGQAIAYETAFGFVSVDEPSISVDALAELSLQLSTQLRTLAIIELLVNGSSDGFHHHLMRNGRVRLSFLERLRRDGIAQHHHGVSGRVDAVIDSIAAADFETVAAIAALTPRDWQPGHEYEDDYCHAQMLFHLSAGGGVDARFEHLAKRFAAATDGAPDARLDVCVALAQSDQDAFDRAFEGLLKQRAARIQADKARAETITAEVTAMRQVDIEALAMLQLATARGLATQREYQGCPSLARVPVSSPLPSVG